MPSGDRVTVEAERLVAGGEALAHLPSGKVVLVAGAAPGDRVEVELTDERPTLARGRVVHVVVPSPDRVDPGCGEVEAGCGGCDLWHLAPAAQVEAKVGIVADALRRLGRLVEPVVEAGPPMAPTGYRTTVRSGVVDGRAGFRRRSSHAVHPVASCAVAHPLVDELVRDGRFGSAAEVVIRAGAATGERLVVVAPAATGVALPADVVVVGADDPPDRSAYHEVVAGRRFRISARSFFQSSLDGAEALVAAVAELGGAELAGASRVVDAYAGVGLFAATIVPEAARVVAVERSASSVADAGHNLAGRDAVVRRVDVGRWRPEAADVVIADPARDGLGATAAERLAGTGAAVLVLVSCDAASLGRDAALLAGYGYRHERSVVVDLFRQTSHVEVVTRFTRAQKA